MAKLPGRALLVPATAALTIFLLLCCCLDETSSQNYSSRYYNRGRGFYHKPHPCEQSSCYPQTGNLLIGREHRLTASSTCGLDRIEDYCIVSHTEEKESCFKCDSRSSDPQRSHLIKNVIYQDPLGSRERTWWQAENGKQNVSIRLDLESEFHFTHIIITFKTFRPAAMLIERSHDEGKTWQVYRYFAQNCDQSFPGVNKNPPTSLSDVVCESRYSKVHPIKDGEVIFRVLPQQLKIDDPYSEGVQNLLKMTNLRINFTKLHTLGDNLLDNREEIQRKYYYAIYNIIVRGSCSCYGHASSCLALEGEESSSPDKVHGRCNCTHNTQGRNCDQCMDFFNDLPWKPAQGTQSNACKACNCNQHSKFCHFDNAVFEQTGRVSGGVCDGCEDNTMGRNCEMCRPSYYLDPNRVITDRDACQPCDCDPLGSVDEGICDSHTDPLNGLVAGQCHCKTFVSGRRCDHCKNGYWNFDEFNPDGCQECTCNILGTIGNQGCDMDTGNCTCKRNVIGRDCNQCLPKHYGLSEDVYGCRPCDCDPGGSYGDDCDVITGQCRCRLNVGGRQCNEPNQSFYAGMLDYLVYEAELATGSDGVQVEIREPPQDGYDVTWTGIGFMRTFENTDLNFTVDNIRTSMEYDIIIRYEPQTHDSWENVDVVVHRDGPVDPSGPCANALPEEDIKHVVLRPGDRSVAVRPPTCLEQGKTYYVTISFRKFEKEVDKAKASILIDSIAIVPRTEGIPFFQGAPQNIRDRDEYERYRCAEHFRGVYRRQDISDICKKYLYSIGFYVFDGADACDCDQTGSISTICENYGGKCQCKKNVVGRRCDRCAPGTFGFGPEGCSPCDCNNIGSLDNFCDSVSGNCKCRPNVYSRVCDKCQPGFWSFPDCQRCQCNGYADECNAFTGECIDCRNNTKGHYCNSCVSGYFGEPELDKGIPCRACLCPRTKDKGNTFAEECVLDPVNQDVICDCALGYAGSRCEVCADNYYGNPEDENGSCKPCECNKNINLAFPGNCDPHTGQCLQCLFETEGFNCELCKAGYYGDAVNHHCTPCQCDLLGTNITAGTCDRFTGKCQCLPNVIGTNCNECEENHWKIASGEGCEACDCDPVGSYDVQCDPFDGRCSCRPGYGGRRCNECKENTWGNPNIKCTPCNCSSEGSLTMQCNKDNGSCVCREGIGGYNCDTCARGYVGIVPYCQPCGECFNNWDMILEKLKDQTQEVIKAASDIKETGVKGSHSRQFQEMFDKIEAVKSILKESKSSAVEIDELVNLVGSLRRDLNMSITELSKLEEIGRNTTQRVIVTRQVLKDLHVKLGDLNNMAENLQNEAEKLKLDNVEGALNLTRKAAQASYQAQQEAERAKLLSEEAEKQCRRTEVKVSNTDQRFLETQKRNEKDMTVLSDMLTGLQEKIPELNEKVCGRYSAGCDSLCGGAGCGFCGGLVCGEGAAKKAEKALGYAQDIDKNIRKKEMEVEDEFKSASKAQTEMEGVLRAVEEAYIAAQFAKNMSEAKYNDSASLAERLEQFLNQEHATPADISSKASETIKKEIKLQPILISELAEGINKTLMSIKGVDQILAETREDKESALRLKIEADGAKNAASALLTTAEQVYKALEEAKEAQEKADGAIEKANSDVQTAEKNLAQIASETSEAQTKANETLAEVESLEMRLQKLQTRFVKNAHDVKELTNEASAIVLEGEQTRNSTVIVQRQYEEATKLLEQRSKIAKNARTRADGVLERASSLFTATRDKLSNLDEMQNLYDTNEHELTALSNKIDDLNRQMNEYMSVIRERAYYYETCTT